jgi:predicted acylesterase/phospholipase RssA
MTRTVQVLTGCSSGALGALLYADALADMLKELKIGAKVFVVVDAGWFVRSAEQELRLARALRDV